MLKGIDQRLSAEIVHVLMLMGHGDDLVICDVNHPAVTIAKETNYGALVDMAGCNLLGDPERVLPLFADMQATCTRIEGREISLEPLERFEFYDRAKHAFAIIRTSDSGPYGCFLLTKGVIDLPPL